MNATETKDAFGRTYAERAENLRGLAEASKRLREPAYVAAAFIAEAEAFETGKGLPAFLANDTRKIAFIHKLMGKAGFQVAY